MLDMLLNYFVDTGFAQFHWSNGVMILIGLVFIYLAVKKGFEPLLLVPIGFGVLIGNIPYDVMKLNVGVHDGPTSEANISYYTLEIDQVRLKHNDEGLVSYERALQIINEEQAPGLAPLTAESYRGLMAVMSRGEVVHLVPESVRLIPFRSEAIQLLEHGQAVLVNTHSVLTMDPEVEAPAFVEFRQGRMAFIPPATAPIADGDPDPVTAQPVHEPLGHLPPADQGKFAELWSLEKQDSWNAGVFWMLFRGIEFGFFPPLIFLGIGALTDFGPLLAQPKTFLLGAAAQLGIFGALLLALLVGFQPEEAAAIGIIGGADGPTSIFVCSKLAPDLLGAVALSAYSYMAMVPIIQPPIIRLLTSSEERKIRMEPPQEVSKTLKIMFPVIAFLLTAFIAPGALALLGMLFFGNLLRESMVTDRLARTAGGVFIDIVTILLGVVVGAKTSASTFLTGETIWIFLLGIVAFSVSTAGGVMFGKLMCYTSGRKINPMIGAAGVSAVPMAARVVQRVAHEEDPQNFLLMHAMGPNVAGVIGSAVAAGVLLSYFAG